MGIEKGMKFTLGLEETMTGAFWKFHLVVLHLTNIM
jgi:hypothetical protein